jgi:hypothetical protein
MQTLSDSQSQVRRTVALAAPGSTRLLDEEATCSMKVQQPCHTWPTAANLYRLRPEHEDLQRPLRNKLRICECRSRRLWVDRRQDRYRRDCQP